VNRNLLIGIGVALGVLVLLAGSALFTVHQTQQALVLQFGNPKRIIREPGLHVKLPFVQNAIYIDRRVLDYDAVSEEVILGDQKRLVVDAFARYRITDPLLFYQTVGSEAVLRGRINTILDASLRKVLGEVPLFTVLSEDRSALMNRIRDQANVEAKQFGIDVIDVRLKRADLPAENSQAIYRRMQTEREREAKELRAQGAEMAQRIRARADRERVVLLAEARKEAQITRGEGDATAVAIFADAFGQDPEFFAFYRSMQAYRDALGDDNTSFVLSPDSEFFRYFNSSSPGGPPAAAAIAPAGPAPAEGGDQGAAQVDDAPPATDAEDQAAADAENPPAPADAVVR
jgi:membrane protease subunit HflC